MKRRRLLRTGLVVAPGLAGCITVPDGGSPSGGRRISLVEIDDPPEIPVRPEVEVTNANVSETAPPRIRVTVTNIAEFPLEVGEERAIVFAFVHSQERPGVQLLPEPANNYPAVDSGCWRLAEPIFIPEYYGIVRLTPGESISQTLGVWGSSDLERGCLPSGEFHFLTAYTAARDESDGFDDPEYVARWGFRLRIME